MNLKFTQNSIIGSKLQKNTVRLILAAIFVTAIPLIVLFSNSKIKNSLNQLNVIGSQTTQQLDLEATNIIAYAKVTVNGVSEKKVIHRRERLKDGRVAVYVQITPQVSGTATVQRVQLYNKNNKLWADKAVNIPLNNVQEGVLYRFTFDFTEKEV